MKKITYSAFLLILAITYISCKKDAPGPDYQHWSLIEVVGAQQASVGETVSLMVSWPYSSGCDVMDKFLTKKEGRIFAITASAIRKMPYVHRTQASKQKNIYL